VGDDGLRTLRSTAACTSPDFPCLMQRARNNSVPPQPYKGSLWSQAVFELFKRACQPRARFAVHLGATECSTLYLEWYVDEFMPRTSLLPVGRSVPERSTVLLDEDGRPVPDGVVGEFVVSSSHLALGCWRDPHLTALAFSTDPVDPQVRVFKTDLGRRRPDGLFEHIGRKDDQIKLRGHRIDPTEIESVLRELADFREAAVVVRRDETGMPQSLAAYVEQRSSIEGLHPSDLRSTLANRLPHYMIPATFQLVEAPPRLPNLKIDRVRLKELDAARRLEQRDAASGRNPRPMRMMLPNEDSIALSPLVGPLHFQIAEIWQRLVGREDIGFDDNFFEIGGDSLLATQMICEVEAVTGQKKTPSALRTVFTIRELTATVMHSTPTTGERVTRAKQGRGTPFLFCHGDYATRGFYALRLVEMLMCDQPVYLLHPFLDSDPELSIKEMAQACLPHILEANSTDAFSLGGHCNGGLFAWEIAHQLERLGSEG
jgi:hypothetical protein